MVSDPEDPFAVAKDVPEIGKGDEPSPFEFSNEDLSPTNLPPFVPARPFPWLVVGSIAGGLLLVVVLGIFASSFLRHSIPVAPAVIPTFTPIPPTAVLIPTPVPPTAIPTPTPVPPTAVPTPTPLIRALVEAPVQCFYRCLDDMDTGRADLSAMRECFDPDIVWVDNMGAILSRIWPTARTILPTDVWDKISQTPSTLSIALDFQELEIKAVEPVMAGATTSQVVASSNLYIKTADGRLLWKQHLDITHFVVKKYNRWYLTFSGSEKTAE